MLCHVRRTGATPVGQQQVTLDESGQAQYLLDSGRRHMHPLKRFTPFEGVGREAPAHDGSRISDLIPHGRTVDLNE